MARWTDVERHILRRDYVGCSQYITPVVEDERGVVELSFHRLANEGDIVRLGRTGQKSPDHQLLGAGYNLLRKSEAEHVDKQPHASIEVIAV